MSTVVPLAYSQIPIVRPPRGPLARTLIWLLQTLGWMTIGALIVGGTTYAVASVSGLVLAPFAPIGVLLLLISGAMLARGVRRVRDLSVLHYLEHAIRLDAPLTTLIAAAERSERGGVRARLRRLRLRLEDGSPLADALSNAAPALPPRIIGLVAAGENTGRLAASLRRILGRRDLFPAGNPTHSIFYRWYPLVLLAFCLAVIQLLLIFILPKFEQFRRDFRLPDRPALRWADQISDNFGVILLIAAGCVLLVFCGRMTSMLFTARVRPGPLRGLFERTAWFTPIVGGVVRSRALADACHVLAEAIDAGCEPGRAIAVAAAAAPNSVMARKLKRWAALLPASSDRSAAARAARLPKLLWTMLATADESSHLPDVFRLLCRYYDGRFSRTLTLLRGALIPGIALAFGVVVAVIALNVFQPLVDLVNKLTGR
jgi:type II secretory pathway component PulF